MSLTIFNRNFDEEDTSGVEPPGQEKPEVVTMTKAQFDEVIKKAQSDAQAKGYEEGHRAGEDSALSKQAGEQSDSLATMSTAILDAKATLENHSQTLCEGKADLILETFELLLGTIADRSRAELCATEISELLSRSMGSPWLDIYTQSPASNEVVDAVEKLKTDAPKALEINLKEDQSLNAGQIRAIWEHGRSNYDLNLLCREIFETISSYIKPKESGGANK